MEAQAYEPTSAWLPRELVARARQQTLELFLHSYASRLSLVVVLEDALSELALGLRGALGKGPEPGGLPFRTAAADSTAAHTDSLGAASAARGGTEHQRLMQRLDDLSRRCCYVAPLRKRGEAAFLDSISVGRARNHDIVLRHASVSKYHANIEVDGDGLFVKDAGSRNHTFVNHERIEGRVRVAPGDVLRFGWVEALVATDQGLWELAQRS